MKIMKNIKIIFSFILIFIFCISQYVCAFNVTDLSGTAISNSDATKFGNQIITVVSTIGSIMSVIVLIVIGLKYMTGSIEEKAQYKKTLMPYVIGCILVFAASTIAGIIYTMAT